MNTPRAVETEWLDRLPADDPRAVRSRADLKVINAWMRQAGIMAHALMRHWGTGSPRTLLDLGAGDGTFLLRVAHRLPWRNVAAVLLDRQDIVAAETRAAFAALGWQVETVRGDVLDLIGHMDGADAIGANLFLHHLTAEELRRLFAAATRSASLFVACEPRRGPFGLLASRMVGAIGCGDVSRHDAVASVRAGFRRQELSALWPASPEWELHEYPAVPFTHCFAARRHDRPPP
jgi:SAM-dependent methyltransferase